MAYYSIYPQKDTTIYSHPDRKHMNTGHDEILELAKEKGSSDNVLYPSRILIQFKTEDIQEAYSKVPELAKSKWTASDVIQYLVNSTFNPNVTNTLTASVQLTSTDPINLTSTQNVEMAIVTASNGGVSGWSEGTGRYDNLPTGSNGASWVYMNNTTEKQAWRTGSFGTNITGSVVSSSLITQGGGAWYENAVTAISRVSQQFLSGDSLDTDLDATQFIHRLMLGTTCYNIAESVGGNAAFNYWPYAIPENNGFVIKIPDVVENNVSHSLGILNYFSVDTHTIYAPKLTFKWDDSVHNKQSSAKKSGELNVTLYNNKKTYNQNDEATIRVHVRDKYPTRTFATTSNYLDAGYFTTSSFYSVRDAHTEREIIPFDNNNTKMSADSEGMYFKLYMRNFQPERHYRILFKHINDEGTTIYDDNYYFKVIR